MIRMRKSWALVRMFLIEQEWNISNDTKQKWVQRMDKASKAHVTLFPDKEEIELGLRSCVDDVNYCAWKKIKISSFSAFVALCEKL